MSGGGSDPAVGDGGRVQRQELFISYSRRDLAFLEEFWTHLKPLETQFGLQRWDDSRIQPGDVWLEEIEQALQRAQVALLLVSPYFLASDFIQRKELPTLFDAAKKDGLKILWLPIRPCSWKRHRQIEQYQALIPVNTTLAEMGEVERDRAMVRIIDHIHDLFERIQDERLAAQQAIAAEALAQREEQERRIADQEAQRQREEKARLERLQADSEARAELERWRAEAEAARAEAERTRAEAERTRAEMERLAREKEEWQRQGTGQTSQQPAQPSQLTQLTHPAQPAQPAHAETPEFNGTPLIQIPTTRGWLVREGKEWRKREESITVPGFREELAPGVAITMLRIPQGEFEMGSPPDEHGRYDDEGPKHRVKLRRFFLGQTVVTQAQWKVVAGWSKQERELNPDPSRFKGANRPVETVSWEEAMEFCLRLGQRTQRVYTLPSEAQWEYACRAGTTTPFAFGETLSTELANYDGNFSYCSGPTGDYRQETTEVQSFPANPWGLHDMHGNVWECCLDSWGDSYDSKPIDGSAWTAGNHASRLLRGGSWYTDPRSCRSACCLRDHTDYLAGGLGFRLCCITEY